ncbi:hypothetical protein ASE14_05495 [Agromyces sp. Root81]|uniref:DUF2304 domain-containing protein n=1 Tax=Agromyces sp. Root81 TaxID=1736601 RepID=UPI0006F580A2|nr:DUF2304 domain-containing protein [Agromyces sp. Root81]KRC60475.1 hypothetical protein ASE14_05495 [Agromyces sp. Root81]
MNPVSYIFGIVVAIAVLGVVIEMLRRRRLRERHAIWWLLAGVFALVIGVFPQTLQWASDLVGVEVPTNLVFFVSLAVLFLVCLQHSAELTDLENQNRALAEGLALQDLRIRELESHARTNPSDESR